MVRCNRIVLTIVILSVGICFLNTPTADAGQCSGVLAFKDGSKGSGIRVSGLVSGGGVTKNFFTDNKGNFTITWSSNAGLAKLYVRGNTAARNIKNGATGLRIVVP